MKTKKANRANRTNRDILCATSNGNIVSASIMTLIAIAAFEGAPSPTAPLTLGFAIAAAAYWIAIRQRNEKTHKINHLALMGDTVVMVVLFFLCASGMVFGIRPPPKIEGILIGIILITSLWTAAMAIAGARQAIARLTDRGARVPPKMTISWIATPRAGDRKITILMMTLFILAATGMIFGTRPTPATEGLLLGIILATSPVIAVKAVAVATRAIKRPTNQGAEVSRIATSNAGERELRASRDILLMSCMNSTIGAAALSIAVIKAFEMKTGPTILVIIGLLAIAGTNVMSIRGETDRLGEMRKMRKTILLTLMQGILIKAAIMFTIVADGLIVGVDPIPMMGKLAIGGLLITALVIAIAGTARATRSIGSIENSNMTDRGRSRTDTRTYEVLRSPDDEMWRFADDDLRRVQHGRHPTDKGSKERGP